MQAREVLFPKLFPTQSLVLGSVIPVTNQTTATLQQQADLLSPGAAQSLLAAIKNSPAFANAAPLARRNDPATSKAAARVLTASGGRESAKVKVLTFLKRHRGFNGLREQDFTSHELSGVGGIAHPTVHKRLPDLRRDGLVENGPVRKCSVTGRPSLTWKAK